MARCSNRQRPAIRGSMQGILKQREVMAKQQSAPSAPKPPQQSPKPKEKPNDTGENSATVKVECSLNGPDHDLFGTHEFEVDADSFEESARKRFLAKCGITNSIHGVKVDVLEE